MKIRLLIVFVLLSNVLWAQDFEGTIKWSMKMDITDPKLKAQMEEAEKKMQDPATQAQMKQAMERMNDPQFKKMMESNPQLKTQMEAMIKNMQAGGSMMPTGMTMKTKAGNALTKIEGGPMANMETLSLKDKNESYVIYHDSKTYSVLPHTGSSVTTTSKEPAVTVKKTTETQKILNYTCTKTIVTVSENGHTVTQNFWTTTEIKNLDFRKFADQKVSGRQAMYYKELDGVPLKVEMTMPQGTMTMQVTEIKKETLNASDFQVPAGFTKTALPGQ
jgi:Domain of unknown function (DUF4412)